MSTRETVKSLAAERILVLDGAWGSLLQQENLVEEDFRSEGTPTDRQLKGNFDLLNLSRPDIVQKVHRAYLEAGADITSTNTFSSTTIAQADYATGHLVADINRAAARLAREVADQVVFMVDGRIVEQGSSDEVLNHPQHPRTRQFLSRVLPS